MFSTVGSEDISEGTSENNSSSTSRDAQDSPENTEVVKQNNKREITVNMLIKELVLCIALALTAYGALHNAPTKISKHPYPVRFFTADSLVTDWYRGHLSKALAAINKEDISFLMYYAPWDAESQYVRGEIEKAAKVLNEKVYFAAINCWHPGSECRLQHNKIPSWPILMAYTVTSKGILYRGPRNAHSIVKFLELIMKPLERIASTEDLINLLSTCDAVAVGYTPLTETSKYYNIWYNVALKSREFDVVGEICFAAVTSEETAIDLGVEVLPNARLMMWNDTKEYIVEEERPWNDTALINWLHESFNQPVARLIPLWRKSFTFDKYVDGNPVLILFTPMNPIYDLIPTYALLREVAMEYYNCNNNETNLWTSELIKLQQVQRLLYQQKHFLKFCKEYKFKKPVLRRGPYYKKEVVSQNNKYPWYNSTHKSPKNSVFNFLFKRGLAISKLMGSNDGSMSSSFNFMEECSMLPEDKSILKDYGQCDCYGTNAETKNDETDVVETTMLPQENDPLAPENLTQENIEHFCSLIKFAHEMGPPPVPASTINSNITHITGLACTTNHTLNMIAIDSVRNHHFAESLGIDVLNKIQKTAVVILDSKLESQYILSEEYSAKSIRDFIYNYTNSKLKRTLRTHVSDANHTHYFGSEGTQDQMGITTESVHIADLTTRTFKKAVRKPGETIIVALCNGACPAYLSLALLEAVALMRGCGEKASAARLDAARHDLPWHYVAHAYPAIIVFPAYSRDSEADSRAYPIGARITSSGIVALALKSLGVPHHLRIRLALCARTRATAEKYTCLKEIRDHITTVIGRNLKYWRRTEITELKEALLRRLQHLHKVSLELSLLHTTDLKDNYFRQNKLLESLSELSKGWYIDVLILKNKTRPPKS